MIGAKKNSHQDVKNKTGKGNWKSFFRLITKIELPWLAILIAFIISMTYNQILLNMPMTTASLMSGNLEPAALTSAVVYYIVYGLSTAGNSIISGITTHLAVKNARTKLWSVMTRISMDYYDNHNPSELFATITNNLESAIKSLVLILVTIGPNIYYLVKALMTISSYSALLMISVFAILPLRLIFMVVVGRWNYQAQASIYLQIGTLTGYLAERIKNLSLIKYYTNEDAEQENGKIASDKLFRANVQMTKIECISTAINSVIIVLQYIVSIVLGAILLQKGVIDISEWVAFFLYTEALLSKFNTVVADWQSIKSAQGVISQVADLMDAPQEIVEDGKVDVQKDASIVFENVNFSYGDKPALKNVSFTIPAGSITAIVGLCGSGKSTILNLLERFYENKDGNILIGKQSLKDIPLKELRSKFSYVQQDSGVFQGTLRDIMTYGLTRQISDSEIWNVVDKVGAKKWIESLPNQLDEFVSSQGSSLSGGQRQRLVLAREMLKDADILLLDEPTSALDIETAKAVAQSIFELFKGKTIIWITHDLNLISNVDQVIVLNKGILEGCGTYEKMLQSCQLFADMIHTQNNECEEVNYETT